MAVVIAALRPEQFWVARGAAQNCCRRPPRGLGADLGRLLHLHASVLVDAEIDRVAKDHDEEHRHGGEFGRRRPAIVPDKAEARWEGWRRHDLWGSPQLTSVPRTLWG